jgi:5-methylcytosine-specific restriction protein A
MPTIKKLERKERPQRNNTERRDLRKKAYADSRWCGKNGVRAAYFSLHPLCEECLAKGRVTPGDSVHHKVSPFKGDEVDWSLMLDYNNLETVCKECHGEIHLKEQGSMSAARMIEILESIFEEVEDEDKRDSK